MKNIPLVESIQPTDFADVLGYDDITITLDNGQRYSLSIDKESDADDLVNGLRTLAEGLQADIDSGKIHVLLDDTPLEFGLSYRD